MTVEHPPYTSAPTLEMVAAAAGVSRSTVSRVVNASPNVTAEAIAAVERAIEDLGYVPNRAARILASRRTF
ncbi:MAG: LacI family DNA-binding transcriptional regulator, partial [Pseudolysinimonas sp.]